MHSKSRVTIRCYSWELFIRAISYVNGKRLKSVDIAALMILKMVQFSELQNHGSETKKQAWLCFHSALAFCHTTGCDIGILRMLFRLQCRKITVRQGLHQNRKE